MKKITVILMGLIMIFGLSSCVTAVHAQDDAYTNESADVTVVLSYGTPYIVNGMIEYYLYNGWYYYPYWRNNSYYFYRYSRPLPRDRYYRWHRPIPRDYRYIAPSTRHHRPGHGYYHVHTPRHNNIGTHTRTPHWHNNMSPRSGGHNRRGLGGRR